MFKRASLHHAVELFFVLFTSIVLSGCGENNSRSSQTTATTTQSETLKTERSKLHILVSNPLAGVFGKLKRQFEMKEPSITVTISTSAESLIGNKAKGGRTEIDFIASTDYKTLQTQLLREKFCTFITLFATDEIVIASSKQSTFSDRLNKDNWRWVFSRKDVVFGYANPKTDACGLRTVMVWELADKYYRRKIKNQTIREWMESPSKKKIMRPSVLQLFPLLTTGTVDFIFIYRSLAEQHNLPYTRLREAINLSQWNQKSKYSKAEVLGRTGEVVSFAFTIPKNSPNKISSAKFGNFLLSDTGTELLQGAGLNIVSGGATMFTTATVDIPIGK